MLKPNSENYLNPRIEFDQLSKYETTVTPEAPDWSLDPNDPLSVLTTGNGMYFLLGALIGPNANTASNIVVGRIPTYVSPLSVKLMPATTTTFMGQVAEPNIIRVTEEGQIILSLAIVTTEPVTLYINDMYFRAKR